jgi:Ca2+-binding RTX toxin-like protein
MVFSGSLTDVNTALATLSYQGDAAYSGSDTLTMTSNDLGNTGSGGALTDTDTVGITVNVTNHAPTDITLIANPNVTDTSFPTSIGTLVATDQDVGDTFTYSILSTTLVSGTAATFSISGSTLNTAGLANNSTYALDIQVQDNGGLTYHEVFNVITGNGNGDNLSAGVTDDVIYGLNGADLILAGSGNDTVFGQGANDTLSGGLGNDTLYGGGAGDTLTGGAGADHFAYALAVDSSITYKSNGQVQANNIDTISDFSHAEGDTIDFSAIAGVTNYAGQLAGSTLAAHSVGWITSGGNTIVYVNDTANAETITAGATYTADMEIHVTGVTSLTSSDFLLHS